MPFAKKLTSPVGGDRAGEEISVCNEKSSRPHFEQVRSNAPITFAVHGVPVPQARPRLTRLGNAYTPAKARDYKERVRAAALDAMGSLSPVRGPIGIAKSGQQVSRVRSAVQLQLRVRVWQPGEKLLVSRGANIHATTSKGDTALHRAVGDLHSPSAPKPIAEGRLAVVDLLLRRGASVKAAGFLGDKPLHLAATRGYVEAVELLLRHDADVDAPDESGSTPLHHAAMHGRVDVSAQLLSRGANVNARSQHNTPLSLAVRFNHNDVAALLLKHGGDVRFVSNQGKTLFDELMDSNRPWTPQRGDMAKLLLDAGIDIHDGASKQGTPLHRAVQRERKELAELLINRGANVNARDQQKRTPLHVAVGTKSVKIVEMLVENGAEINPRDSQGHTPIHYAWGSGVSEQIQELLRRHGGVGAFGESR